MFSLSLNILYEYCGIVFLWYKVVLIGSKGDSFGVVIMIKTVVYDCDGVIVNSTDSIFLYYNKIMNECGLPPIDWSEEEIKQKAFSMADRDILEVLSAGDHVLYNKMLEIARNDDASSYFSGMTIENGLIESLEIIKRKGIHIAVFTNRGRSLPSLLEYFGIKEYFSILVTSADVSLPKPSPEGLLKICKHFAVEPAEILFVGDSPTDYHAALSCGANFIAFKKTLWDAQIITDHRQIIDYINVL